MTVTAAPNSVPALAHRAADGRVTLGRARLVLVFRLVGFAAVQALIAGFFALRGTVDPWDASVGWWPLVATVVSLLTALLLFRVTRAEGIRARALLSARRETLRGDLLGLLIVIVLSGPIAYLPMLGLSAALWGDPQTGSAMMFRPLPPLWAAVLFIAFPLTVALTELPAYFGYAMPRLEALRGRSWAAVGWASFFLAAQHITLPLIFDWRFILWRLGMFLPFALLMGIALHRRPTLMPYLMAGHFLIDLSSAYFFLALS
jgi:hypothetical protein